MLALYVEILSFTIVLHEILLFDGLYFNRFVASNIFDIKYKNSMRVKYKNIFLMNMNSNEINVIDIYVGK